MKKIRILHIAQSAGGVDRYIRMLLRYLNKEKFENILICSQDFHEEDYKDLVSFFEKINMSREISVNDIKVIKKVRKIIKKYNPDIVYAHSSKAGVYARIANIGLSSFCIYNPHGWSFNMMCSNKKKHVFTLIERLLAPFCEKIVCISEAEKESALNNKICNINKIKVIFNGIDIDDYENRIHGLIKRSELEIPNDAFLVGMVGRISQQKAPDIFIRMAKQIKKQIPNAHFLIVGTGDLEDEIKEYALKNQLSDRLHITGWVSNPLSYIELFDVACLLSRWEGFGLVLPEYMLVGKPIVATKVDAIPNIIENNKNGLLVGIDDYNGACEAVLKIYHDDHLRRMLVQNGKYDVYNKFNIHRVSYEHEQLFTEVYNRNKLGENNEEN